MEAIYGSPRRWIKEDIVSLVLCDIVVEVDKVTDSSDAKNRRIVVQVWRETEGLSERGKQSDKTIEKKKWHGAVRERERESRNKGGIKWEIYRVVKGKKCLCWLQFFLWWNTCLLACTVQSLPPEFTLSLHFCTLYYIHIFPSFSLLNSISPFALEFSLRNV